ncbi:MAG: RNA 2',3'-cyclic phosphodiesterase [Bacteroidota bacterium]|nr:RNA 2',3'-cyclic phosphodiesterase [Bacteroidota bacterium]
MRTFIAISIPLTTKIKKLLRDLEIHLKDVCLSYTNPNQYHITLAFLGETSSEQAIAISNDLKNLTFIKEPLLIELKGTGLFRNINNPKVLWIGTSDVSALKILWAKVNEIAIKNGFTASEDSFTPHITIGRIKSLGKDNNLINLIEKYKEVDFGKICIPELTFFQSITTSEGAQYKVIEKFKLTE